LVVVGEPVQHDGILPDVGVHVQEHLRPHGAERGGGAGGHGHPVPDATHLHHHLGLRRPHRQGAPQRPDHAVPPVCPIRRPPSACPPAPAPRGPAPTAPAPTAAAPTAAATARRSGRVVRWHTASARASATSGGRGVSPRPSTDVTIRCTCSLVALP